MSYYILCSMVFVLIILLAPKIMWEEPFDTLKEASHKHKKMIIRDIIGIAILTTLIAIQWKLSMDYDEYEAVPFDKYSVVELNNGGIAVTVNTYVKAYSDSTVCNRIRKISSANGYVYLHMHQHDSFKIDTTLVF